MASIVLKRTGHKMPLVGLGLWKIPKASCAETVYNAIKTGYRLLDGAGDYGNEKEAGQGVRRALNEGIVKREELFITSKLWNTFHAQHHVKGAAKMQLDLWGLDYFDLFLVHFPIALAYVEPEHRYPPEWWGDDGKVHLQNTPFQETWGGMEGLVDDGLVKNIGVSNVAGGLLVDILSYARIEPQVLQVELHPYLTQEPLMRLTKTLGIAVTAYSSFGPQSYLELGFKGNVKPLFEQDVVVKAAQAHETEPGRVLLRWATQKGIAVIPKTNTANRLLSNLDSTSFDLTETEIEAISALNINLRLNDPVEIDPRLAIFAQFEGLKEDMWRSERELRMAQSQSEFEMVIDMTRLQSRKAVEIHLLFTMGPVHFKLSMSDGLTRRISFHTRPSWSELATRIQSFCNIPRNRLAMSYVDSDGDEVTLSSEEELRDFYDSNVDNAIQGNQLIRFRVIELGSLRDFDNFMEPISPQPSSTRNTFGRPTPYVFVDHDPPFGPFGDLFVPSPLEREGDSPHAFVEVVDDDGEKEREPSDVGGKGKARDLRPSISDDISSSGSVIADEIPRKPPIHVQVHGLRPMDSGTFGPPPATSTPPRESVTPTLRPILSNKSPEEAPRDLPGSFPDPPTPELGAPVDPNVSLSNDLASLLDSLNSMFLEHQEVGQPLRALFRDVGNWNAQRDSMARVAEDIQRVARDAQSAVALGAQEMARNIRQQAQQEAARRVTESVGNILRAFGASGDELPPSNANIPGSAQMSSSTNVRPPPSPAAAGSAPVWNQFKPFPPVPPPSGPQGVDPSSSAAHPPEVSYYTASANRETRSNTSELKTSLEAAKAHYKAEKEKYRQEQEARRRGRWLAKEAAANSPMSPEAPPVGGQTFTSVAPSDAETSRHPYPSSMAPPLRQIISNARGRFPQLEMFNVPRTPIKQRGDDKVQHVDTVMGRLEVMGFHEATFPTMRTVVESHLPADGSKITKDVEDDVMSEVLEKLLETSGSGSGKQPTSSSK